MAAKQPTSMTEALRAAIRESGKSYSELGRETGVERSSIERFVNGKQSLRLDFADKLAEYFGIKVVISSRKKD